jgi:serine phosphatase RsbU (regulator of sigma subunit)
VKNWVFIICLSYSLPFQLWAQLPIPEEGKFPTINFSPNEFESREGQNHDIVLGPDDRIYVGNNGGILVFNGIVWDLIEDPESRPILSLGFSPDGTLYFGANNSFGFVQIDNQGTAKLEDLLELLGDNLSNFGRIENILFTQNNIWFYSETVLFVLNQEHQLIREFALKDLLAVFIVDDKPLIFEKNETPKSIDNHGKILEIKSRSEKVNGIMNVQQLGENEFLIIVEGEFILAMIEDGQMVITNRILKSDFDGLMINDALRWKENQILIASEESGLLLMNENGKITPISNVRKGLQSNLTKRMCLDHQKNIWLALDFGVSMVDLNSPLSNFGMDFGVSSNVNDILMLENESFLGTASGLLRWDYSAQKFIQIPGFSGECWSIAKVSRPDNSYSLLCAGENGVYEYFPKKGFEKINETKPFFVGGSKNDSLRYWIGTELGFMTYVLKNNFLVEEHKNVAINQIIRKIETDGEGNIWMAADGYGAIQIKLNPKTGIPDFENLIHFDSSSSLPMGGPDPALYSGSILFGTTDGLFKFNKKEGFFSPSDLSKVKGELSTNYFYKITEGANRRLWVISFDWELNDFQNGYIDPTGELVHLPFKESTEAIVHKIYFDTKNSQIWLGGEKGLFGVCSNGDDYLDYTLDCNIDEMRIGTDSVLFGGFNPSQTQKIVIPYSKKPLNFHFSTTSYKKRGGLMFKYKLEGFDEKWSEWMEKSEVVYTNLPGKKYSFLVKAKDFFEIESEIKKFNFSVLPPWYQTWWAYSIYGVFFLGFVAGVVTISNRGLRMIIKEKTKEITKQKDEIELTNTELESQNEEILAQRDQLEDQNAMIGNKNRQITDSIYYAQRIQLAILPPPGKIKDLLPNSSIMYKPKDIVSGDFYWMEKSKTKKEEKVFFAAVDCTGHGVPGAFVSIIGYNGLNRVVRESDEANPGQILDRLNEIVTKTLNPQGADGVEVKDGMDISLCSMNKKSLQIEYSGAHNSLYIIRKSAHPISVNEEDLEPILEDENNTFLFEIKPDKMPIGAFEKEGQFRTRKFQALKDDLLFLFTDGFPDQFGGKKGKKYMYRSFKKFLMKQIDIPVSQINSNLEKEYEEWKGETEQIDDVCIIAVRV